MSKPANRAYSRYSENAALLLGRLVRRGRIENGLTVAALAEHAGVSRGLVQRIERGEMGCAIGSVFQVAAIVGVPLFEPSPEDLRARLSEVGDQLALLPAAVPPLSRDVKDDF